MAMQHTLIKGVDLDDDDDDDDDVGLGAGLHRGGGRRAGKSGGRQLRAEVIVLKKE